MPFYEYRLTVPANTPASNPVVQEVTLIPGRIIAFGVQFPLMCRGLANAQIWVGEHDQWPTNPDSSLSGDGVVIEWREEYDLDPTAPRLRLVAWNLDDSYAHTVTFRINIIPKDIIDQAGRALTALDYLARWYETRT